MAIDAGATSDLNGNSIIKDQRDFFRDAKPDIGAFAMPRAPFGSARIAPGQKHTDPWRAFS